MTRFLCPFCSGDPGKEGSVCERCSRPLIHDGRMRSDIASGVDPRYMRGIAEKALDTGDLETAERACDTILFTHPRNTHAWFFKGIVDMRTGFHSAALDCWSRSVLLSTDVQFLGRARDVTVRETVRENIRLMGEGRFIHGISRLSDAFVHRTGVGISDDVRDGTRIANVPKDVLADFIEELEGEKVHPLTLDGKEFTDALGKPMEKEERIYLMAGYFSGSGNLDHDPSVLCRLCDGADVTKTVAMLSSSRKERSVRGFMGMACLLADAFHLVDDAESVTKCLSAVSRYAAAIEPYAEGFVETMVTETVRPFDALLEEMEGSRGRSKDAYRRKQAFEALCMACLRSDEDAIKMFCREYSGLFR